MYQHEWKSRPAGSLFDKFDFPGGGVNGPFHAERSAGEAVEAGVGELGEIFRQSPILLDKDAELTSHEGINLADQRLRGRVFGGSRQGRRIGGGRGSGLFAAAGSQRQQ